MRQIRFDTFEGAIEAVGDISDGLDANVTITSEDDGTYMVFGHGEKVATWICGDKEDDLPFYGVTRESHPTSGYLVLGTHQVDQDAGDWRLFRHRNLTFLDPVSAALG